MTYLEVLGLACAEHRRKIGKTQVSVAIDTNYSVENISRFERGYNDNLRILAWYVINGFDFFEFIMGGFDL